MDSAEAAAMLLRKAASGERIADLPEAVRPKTIEEAYAIQDVTLRRAGAYGWKVGPGDTPDGLCAAPLHGSDALLSPAELAYATGLAIEVEIAMTLKNDLAADASAEDVAKALGILHLAYELFRSRYADRMRVGFLSVLADHINNDGIVVGPATPAETDMAFETMPIVLFRDGEEIARTDKGVSRADMLANIAWLATHASRRGSPLIRGTVILTGARIGPVDLTEGSRYRADSPLGSVELALRPR